MITHYIIMSSSYTKGKRIALDYLLDEKTEYHKLNKIIKTITDKCGKDVSISTHFVQTDSESWNSVSEKDYFFKDVEVVKNIEDFINLIQQDRILTGLDVAKYILSKVICTHLKLEKLVYLCYAEYLCNFDKDLFVDEIYAYKYGPVIKSVYEKYKKYRYAEIEKPEDKILSEDLLELPSRSRIMFAEDGLEKINSIDSTLKIYGQLSAGELVDLTHKEEIIKMFSIAKHFLYYIQYLLIYSFHLKL